jgi:hypothetical protein
MKLLNIIILAGLLLMASCKKTTTDPCTGTTLTAFLDFEKDIQCITAPCYTLKVTLSTGEVIRFNNLDQFNLEQVDQTIEFVGKQDLRTMPAIIPYHIDCIVGKTLRSSCTCPVMESIHLKPLEVTCQATNCPQFTCTKSDGSVILITNLNDFKLNISEQDVKICFDENVIKTNPPQFTAKCVEKVDDVVIAVDPNDPLPCDQAIIGTMSNENGAGGCGWLIHLSNGETVHALNMYGFAGLQVEGAKVSVGLDYNVDAPTACNKAKPVFILCGSVITTP